MTNASTTIAITLKNRNDAYLTELKELTSIHIANFKEELGEYDFEDLDGNSKGMIKRQAYMKTIGSVSEDLALKAMIHCLTELGLDVHPDITDKSKVGWFLSTQSDWEDYTMEFRAVKGAIKVFEWNLAAYWFNANDTNVTYTIDNKNFVVEAYKAFNRETKTNDGFLMLRRKELIGDITPDTEHCF